MKKSFTKVLLSKWICIKYFKTYYSYDNHEQKPSILDTLFLLQVRQWVSNEKEGPWLTVRAFSTYLTALAIAHPIANAHANATHIAPNVLVSDMNHFFPKQFRYIIMIAISFIDHSVNSFHLIDKFFNSYLTSSVHLIDIY